MTEPNRYEFSQDAEVGCLESYGFMIKGDIYKLSKVLRRYNNSKNAYVILRLRVEYRNKRYELDEYVACNNGEFYIPFYNPDMRHYNLVYEEVVTNYNNFMDELVKKKILKHVKDKKHGKSKHKETDNNGKDTTKRK